MKRIVAGVDDEGRSYVVSAEELPAADWNVLWWFHPADIAATIAQIPDAAAAVASEPPPGGVKWVLATWPASAGPLATRHPGVDDEGFHTTRTVDFVYLISGELTLLLDRESVTVHAGDVVVQQAVRHAWRNDSGEPAVLLAWAHAPALLDDQTPAAEGS